MGEWFVSIDSSSKADPALKLQAMTVEYATQLYEHLTDEDIYMMDGYGYGLGNLDKFVHHQMTCQVILYNWQPAGSLYHGEHFGFWVIEKFRGKNIAYKASLMALKGYHAQVIAGSLSENRVSQHILDKLGFKEFIRMTDDFNREQIWYRLKGQIKP